MNENLNDQFPPISRNGKATGKPGRTGRTTPNGSGKTRLAGQGNNEPTHPNSSRPTPTGGRSKPSPGAQPQEAPQPAQLVKAKVSAYIAAYPIQIIGGLLGLLLVVLMVKTFYQGKNWKAQRTAEEAYYVANQYARNNSTNLTPYLSQAFRREVRQFPGLLPLSMQTATRGGSITAAESVNLRQITPDSVVVEMRVLFEPGSGVPLREEKRYQPLVYEKEQWRLGLTFSK